MGLPLENLISPVPIADKVSSLEIMKILTYPFELIPLKFTRLSDCP